MFAVCFVMDILLLSRRFCDEARYLRGQSPATIRRYARVIKDFAGALGVSELDQVTAEGVRSFFFTGRSIRQWRSSTFISYHSTLSVFFAWCLRQGLIASSPIADVEKPRLEKRLPPKLSRQEALRLLEVAYNYP